MMGVRSLWRIAVTVVALSVALIHPLGAAQFEDINVWLNIPGTTGAAWGDYDNDGYPDLFLSGSQPDYLAHPEYLLHNNGNLTFTDVSAQVGLPTTQQEDNGVAWADYDNDGLLDVLVGCAGTGFEKLYHHAASTLTDVANAAGFNASARPARTISWCDYDGDGFLDVFVSKIFLVGSLYRNNGDGTFTDVTAAAGMSGLASPVSAVGSAWGDYDNDGHPDLMLSRYQLAPLLYHSNGDGTFTEVSMHAGISAAVDGVSAAWADYDSDGWLDCYISSYQSARDWLFHNNHDGTFTDVAATAGMAGDHSVGIGVAWADYDNDGFVDLYVGNLETNNEPFLYHNNGDGTFTEVASTTGVAGSYSNEAAMWADIDRDGKLDLFQAVGGPIARLFHNIGPAGNWLRVRALTTGTGDATDTKQPTRDAIGAVVSLNLDNDEAFPTGAARTLMRVVDGGSGCQSQNEQIAQFGLGDATMVAVRVRFPDGSVVTHKDVAANQQITIKDVPADYVEIFTDVPLDYWSYPQVKAVEDANIVKGYDGNLYQPDWSVTRDQMAVFVARAMNGGDPTGPATVAFIDIADPWANAHIAYCVEYGVVQGYDSTHYAPTAVVDRGQLAVFVARAMGWVELADNMTTAPQLFPDVPAGFWSGTAIKACLDNGVVQGYDEPDGSKSYRPGDPVTRDQMAVYVARAWMLL